MSLYYLTKHWLKTGRWKIRRAAVAMHWGADRLSKTPAVFGNSMPKSGSHLIIQILLGLTRFGPFVNPGYPPVNRSEDNRNLSSGAVLENIERMRPGDIRYGYIHAQEPFVKALTGPDRATIFVYRDPRDMIVSHVFYATEIHKGHGMHPYYTQVLNSVEERINAQIMGVAEPGFELSPIRKKYDAYLCWLEQPQVLSVRFEDLILDRDGALNRLLDYLKERGFAPEMSRSEAIEILKSNIAPHKSGTFRKGKPGNWREHFTAENIASFKQATGDLLIRLGYEQDGNW
jgi:hypothetical protein